MPTRIGKRLVVIGSTATTTQPPRRRPPVPGQRVGKHRLVIIKDGQFVRDRASR
jgi:hypothetical protein